MHAAAIALKMAGLLDFIDALARHTNIAVARVSYEE